MKKKSETISYFYFLLNKKRNFVFSIFYVLLTAISFLLLSGCAKTGYPQPPKIVPPHSPVILKAEKNKNIVRIVYRYVYDLNRIKGFLIYRSYYKNKKNAVKSQCNSSKPFAFQNLNFKKRFSLQNSKFFYNVNSKVLRNGYYVFCIKSVGNFNIKSDFSNYKIIFIKIN